ALSLGGCDRLRAAVGAAPPLHGAAYTPPVPAPPLRLTRAAGATADTFDLARDGAGAGRAALVFFGYTHCPDVCPTTLADWTHVKRALAARDPADTARVHFIFVTVDPERDSAAVVAHYLAQFDPGFVGLTGSRAAIDATQAAWHVSSFREPAPVGAPATSYAVSHSAQVFLVGPDGRLRAVYPLNAPAADVAADLHQVLSGG
ncbi:MAG: SCO family protein, partial [Candidatus Eremiobacteraeota bacterium]|nr:SCO family protein [Candidatus Eremiobacteraeota bacterium]